MRLQVRRPVRRGVVLAEAAIVTLVFLTLLLGTVDLGLGVFRFNSISQAARFGARQAIVHGNLAATGVATGSGWGPWGPTTINQVATATGTPAIDAVRPMLVGCNLSDTHVKFEWLNNDNSPEKPVRVTVTTTYKPIMLWVFGNVTINLQATSTMLIAH